MVDRPTAPAGGEMGERIRSFDWSATPLGTPAAWPSALRVTLDLCLKSAFPMAIYWGPELRLLYNDGWSPIPGRRHPHALGRPAHEVWPDIWPIVGPQFAAVMENGHGYAATDQPLPMTRSGRLEESYWDYSFTPITGDDGRIAGILNQGHEVTSRVLEARQQALMLALSGPMRATDDPDSVVRTAIDALGPHLGVMRAGYAEVDLAGGTFRIVHNWRRDAGVVDLVGVHPLGRFGADLHAALRSGAVFGVDDAWEDRRVHGRPMAQVYAAIGVRAGLVVPVLKNDAYAAAIFVQHDEPRYWVEHHERLLAAIGERIWQERGRAQAARALAESERRHRLIFEQASDIVFTADPAGIVTGANPAAGAALGLDAGALVGCPITDFIGAEQVAQVSGMTAASGAGNGTTRCEVAVRAHDGQLLRWEINSTLALDDAGRVSGLHAIARDVTDRHRHEREQRRLIDELNHRVKNMLAQVQGLAAQSFRGGKPVAEAQAAFQARLGALAAAYDLLTREKWDGATLEETVAGGTRPFVGDEARVSRSGPAVVLTPKTAVSLVMAFHELATNARDHGALSGPDGRVEIGWGVAGERLLIVWTESGGPAVSAPGRRGFGLRMVERALAADLSATVTMDFTPGGLRCLIDAPLSGAETSLGESEE